MNKVPNDKWSVEDNLYVLEQTNANFSRVEWQTLMKQIAKAIDKKPLSVARTVDNCKFIATGKGLSHTSSSQEEATKIFIERHGKKMFKLI
jgi:hypothetical protein